MDPLRGDELAVVSRTLLEFPLRALLGGGIHDLEIASFQRVRCLSRELPSSSLTRAGFSK